MSNIGHRKFASIPDCIGVGSTVAVQGSVGERGHLDLCYIVSLVLSGHGCLGKDCSKRIISGSD